MKMLLDSNVWRYIVNENAQGDLERTSRECGVEVVVVPALIFEARDFKDDTLRKSLLRVLTNPGWTRLMPDAFLEAEEIKSVVRRFRPEWLVSQPDLTEVNALKWDWERADGGFWSRAQDDSPLPETDERYRSDQEHALARIEAVEIRKRVFESKQTLPEISLLQAYGVPPDGVVGSDGEPVEYWRVPSLFHICAELAVYASPYREWLDSEVDIESINALPASLTKLWYYEIAPSDAPRQWLRGAFEFLQAFHKVTPGSPVDSLLSAHLLDVDIAVSADRNFVRFAEKCRTDAPFHIARSCLVSGGAAAIPELMAMLEKQASC